MYIHTLFEHKCKCTLYTGEYRKTIELISKKNSTIYVLPKEINMGVFCNEMED